MKRKRGTIHSCHLCPFTHKYKSRLKRHLAHSHGIGVTWHNCELCNYKCKRNTHLKIHMANKHDMGIQWHQCNHCDYKCKQQCTLKRHLMCRHDINVRWLKCDLCDYKSVDRGALKRHKAFKHGINVTWHQCDHCTYKAKYKSLLKRHKAFKHDINVRWLKCDLCDFKCKDNLKQHIAHVHDIGNKYCDICYESVGVVRSIKGANVCRSCCDEYGFRKERIELKYIKALQKRFPYHMEHDTRVQGDMCLRYRPDAMWLDPHLKCHIQFELDEHQHLWKNGSYDCDEKRISDIYDEFKSNVPEHFVVVRLNPDSELGRAAVFKDRLNHLVEVLERVKTSPPKEKISIIYMYYDKNNHRIAKNLPKYLLDKDNKII